MTNQLKEAMHDMLAAEPPAATTSDDIARAGRRQVIRRRTAVATGSLAVAASLLGGGIALVPTLTDRPAVTVRTGAAPSGSAASVATVPTPGKGACKGKPSDVRFEGSNVSVIPDMAAAARAIEAEAGRIAPGMQFQRVRVDRTERDPKTQGPRGVALFNVGDQKGTGMVAIEVTAQRATPAQRAERDIRENVYGLCGQPKRQDLPSGAVVVTFPTGHAPHVRYYAPNDRDVYVTSDPGPVEADGPPDPTRNSPLTEHQLFEVAQVVGTM